MTDDTASKKKTTIYDIAKDTGFSPSTVSRVLSLSEYPVNAKTRQIIENAAIRLKYFTHFPSKGLYQSSSNEIGVLIPNISNYHYTTLLQGIQDITAKNDGHVLLCDSLRDVEREKKNVCELIRKQVKGILIASIDSSGENINQIIANGIPVVSMEQTVNTPCITTSFNFFSGANLAMEHLIEEGHREIAFVSPPLVRSSRKELFNGYRFVSMQHGLEVNEKFIYISEKETIDSGGGAGSFEFEVGKKAVDYFMSQKNHPTAIFCVNDLIAIGALRRLKELSISVPEEIAIIGFDNIIFSEMTSPSLTTIDQSAFELGQTATSLLLNKIADDSLNENISVLIEPKLIRREST